MSAPPRLMFAIILQGKCFYRLDILREAEACGVRIGMGLEASGREPLMGLEWLEAEYLMGYVQL